METRKTSEEGTDHPSVWHANTHTYKVFTQTHTAPCMGKKCQKEPHRAEESTVHRTQTFNFHAVCLTPYIFIQASCHSNCSYGLKKENNHILRLLSFEMKGFPDLILASLSLLIKILQLTCSFDFDMKKHAVC